MIEARFVGPIVRFIGANEANDGPELRFIGPEVHFIGANEANDGPEIRFVGPEIRFIEANEANDGSEIHFIGANEANDGPVASRIGRDAQIHSDVLRCCARLRSVLCTSSNRLPAIAGLRVARALLKEGVETA